MRNFLSLWASVSIGLQSDRQVATMISDIVHGKRAITPEMAYLLGAALGTTPQFCLI